MSLRRRWANVLRPFVERHATYNVHEDLPEDRELRSLLDEVRDWRHNRIRAGLGVSTLDNVITQLHHLTRLAEWLSE